MEPDERFIPRLEEMVLNMSAQCRLHRKNIKNSVNELRHCLAKKQEMVRLLRELRQRKRDRDTT